MVGRTAVARSVDNDDDARWLAQRLHRSFGSSVDVNPRFLGWLLLVIGAGPIELSIAQHNAALGENGTLQFCDSLGIGPSGNCQATLLNKGAGLDVSPAVRDYLGLKQQTDVTDWRFVDFSEVPRGPWSALGENNTFVINGGKKSGKLAERLKRNEVGLIAR
jgi:hypothetical protein